MVDIDINEIMNNVSDSEAETIAGYFTDGIYTNLLIKEGWVFNVDDILIKSSKEGLISLFWAIHEKYEDELDIGLRELFEEEMKK